MDLRAGTARRLEAEANLGALDGMDGAEGSGQAAVELAVPLDVRAQAHGAAEGDHLEDPAQGIAGSLGLVDRLDHAPLRLGVRAADFGGLGTAS